MVSALLSCEALCSSCGGLLSPAEFHGKWENLIYDQDIKDKVHVCTVEWCMTEQEVERLLIPFFPTCISTL